MNPVWQKLAGTQTGSFILGLLGVKLKNSSGDLQVRNNADTEFASVEVKNLELHNNTATESVTITTRNDLAASYTLTLPADDGGPGQVLETDGAGNLSWVSAGDTSLAWKVFESEIDFGDTGPVTLFTLPATAVIDKVSVIVDTAFNGTPSLSVGVDGGNASKYFGSGDALLTALGRYDVYSTEPAPGAAEDLEVAYTQGGATQGKVRVLITYAIPAV
jgi:hypothetical protein